MIHTLEFEVGGKEFYLETGRVAKQAGGAVLLGMGETIVLGVATMSENPKAGIDFLPLTCDYEERKYAVGKIPGGFIKSGGRPSEKAILVSRLMDRPIRPLFPKGMRNDIQVMAMPFAVEQDCPPDVLAVCAAGAALAVSNIPFKAPIACVRVGRIDGEFILFPTNDQIKASDLDLIVAGHKDAISMVESGANEVSEADMAAALKFAHNAIREIALKFEEFKKTVGTKVREVTLFTIDEDLKKAISKKFGKDIEKALLGSADKAVRESALNDLIKDIVEKMKPEYADQPAILGQLHEAADTVVKGVVRDLIITKDKRPDGRKLDELRHIEATAGILPRVHGSGLFTRGQTQVMTIATLGLPGDAQTMDGLEEVDAKRYMHFYNFPAYSVGEVRPNRGRGRREVGHGALAERALIPVLPLSDPQFPYTMLLTSEVLESNGSTSMASVCGSTLALMDAGIQIKAPVAGIAMGLMSDGKEFKVLTDIIGMEDFCGDMDFKVAGTRAGITALQLDTKLDGIPDEVLARALNQALTARLAILDVMEEEINAPRSRVAETAPQVVTMQINPEKIGALIGPGGAMIKKICAESGATVDVQQDGRVLIGSTGADAANKAMQMVKDAVGDIEMGVETTGVVTRIMGRGVLVELASGKQGFVPKEQITLKEINRIEDVVNMGDTLNVKTFELDDQGRLNLTAIGVKQDLPTLEGNEDGTPPPSQGGGGGRPGGDRGRGGDRGGRGGGFGGRDRGGDRGGDRGPRRDGPRPDRAERPASSGGDEPKFRKRQ